MGDQEVRDRPSITWQEFSVRSARQLVLNLANDLSRRQPALSRGSRPPDAHESPYLSQFQTQIGVQ